MSDFVTRFAPSPTGFLHLGHAYSALIASRAAHDAGGRFLLRIEDIDKGRCRAEYESALFEDLAWLGIEWEPAPRRQSDHLEEYHSVLAELISKSVAYRCFRTRKEVVDEIARAPHLSADGRDGPAFIGGPLSADEEQSKIAEGASFAWRLSIDAARHNLGSSFDKLTFVEEDIDGAERRSVRATPQILGDAVIARKDFGTSYHLACVHDDALQGVTHVVRGIDLRAAAHLHTLLQALLGFPQPTYRHHQLITDDNGKRLAKRDHAATLRSRRQSGATPRDVRRMLGLSF